MMRIRKEGRGGVKRRRRRRKGGGIHTRQQKRWEKQMQRPIH
jgi:hypothetical protein